MKGKKGFTLVELLAVIAILAILVIITLPNIISLYNDAKRNKFETEVKTIYNEAQQEWVLDTLTSYGEVVYTKCKDCDGKTLKLSGRDDIDYYIKVDSEGDIVEFYVTDGEYQFQYEGDLLATFIKDVEIVDNLEEEEVFTVTRNGVVGGNKTGYIGPNETLNCPPGTAFSVWHGHAMCNPCKANTYKSAYGNEACTPCPEGTCTKDGVTGATSADACSADFCSNGSR